MEYTVSKFGKLTGVSARTLRYYDEIDLLKPKRVNSNGYRIYGEKEVDALQQILFYRELELSLEKIKKIMHSEMFNLEHALEEHLIHLKQKRNHLENMIGTVEKSIQNVRGEIQMSDQEKFQAFKKEQIQKNEQEYGQEIRQKYGEEVINQANDKFAGMSAETYQAFEELTTELNQTLAEATRTSEPTSEKGQEVAALHQKWIKSAWPKGYYSEEAHFNLSLMYVADERFKAYYENVEPGATEFLHAALKKYLSIEE